MSHLRLVPPLSPTPTDDDTKVALAFFQAASGLCLCRTCAMSRHPASGVR